MNHINYFVTFTEKQRKHAKFALPANSACKLKKTQRRRAGIAPGSVESSAFQGWNLTSQSCKALNNCLCTLITSANTQGERSRVFSGFSRGRGMRVSDVLNVITSWQSEPYLLFTAYWNSLFCHKNPFPLRTERQRNGKCQGCLFVSCQRKRRRISDHQSETNEQIFVYFLKVNCVHGRNTTASATF